MKGIITDVNEVRKLSGLLPLNESEESAAGDGGYCFSDAVVEDVDLEEGSMNFAYYHAAKEADAAFDIALKKQYGGKYQDKRYSGADFNKDTQAAYKKFRRASDAWSKEVKRARNEDVDLEEEKTKPKSVYDKVPEKMRPFGWSSPARGGTPWRVPYADRAQALLKKMFPAIDKDLSIYVDYGDRSQGSEALVVYFREDDSKDVYNAAMREMAAKLKRVAKVQLSKKHAMGFDHLVMIDDLKRDVLKEDVELEEGVSVKMGSNEKVVIQKVKNYVAGQYKKKAANPSRYRVPHLNDDLIEELNDALGSAFKKDVMKAGAKLVTSVEASQGAKHIVNGTPWRYIITFKERADLPRNNDPRREEKDAAVVAWDKQFKKDMDILVSFGLRGERGNPLGNTRAGEYGRVKRWWAERVLLPKNISESVELDEGMSGLISRLQESYFKEEGIEQLTAAKVGAALRKIGIKARASGKDVGIIIKVPEGDHRKALDMLREKFKYPGIGWEGHGKADMWVLEPIEIRHAKARDAERKRVGNWMGKGVNVR